MGCQCKTDKQRAKCPWYIEDDELIEEDAFGNKRLARGCFPVIFLRWIKGVVKSNEQLAISNQEARNAAVKNAESIFEAARALDQVSQPLLMKHYDIKSIDYSKEDE